VKAVIEIDVLEYFVPFVSVTFTVMVAKCVAVLQECPELLDWLNSFLLYASRISPDKKMKSIVRVKFSLISLYGLL
jgi:hypothetical protein